MVDFTAPEKSINESIEAYYNSKLRQFGATPKGVDWKDEIAQISRFKGQYELSTLGNSHPESVLDYGCGYGAYLEYLRNRGFKGKYTGLDIAEEMLISAKSKFINDENSEFLSEPIVNSQFDLSFASGTFNVMFADRKLWLEKIVLPNIIRMLEHSEFAIVSFLRNEPTYRIENLLYIDAEELVSIFASKIEIVKSLNIENTWEFCLLLRKKERN